MGLKGVKVNGVEYHFDHDYLENNPIPDGMPMADTAASLDYGFLARVDGEPLAWRRVLPSTADDGEVLTVSGNNVVWRSVLPSGGNEGDVLTKGADGLEWVAMESGGGSGGDTGLPPYDADDDAGKALLIRGDGRLGWDYAIPTTTCFLMDTFGIMTVTGDIENMEWKSVTEDLLGFPPIENIINRAVLVAHDDDDDYGTYMRWTELDEDLLLDMLPSFGPSDNGKVLMTNGYSVFWGNPS